MNLKFIRVWATLNVVLLAGIYVAGKALPFGEPPGIMMSLEEVEEYQREHGPKGKSVVPFHAEKAREANRALGLDKIALENERSKRRRALWFYRFAMTLALANGMVSVVMLIRSEAERRGRLERPVQKPGSEQGYSSSA